MPDEIAIAALKRKRSELAGELIVTEKLALTLRADIDSMDRTIAVFDPKARPERIRPVLKRTKSREMQWGSAARSTLSVLRTAYAPMTPRQIAEQIAAQNKLNIRPGEDMNHLIAKVRTALSRYKGRALVREIEGETVLWRIA